jgi:ABC-2 type transport system permease protein
MNPGRFNYQGVRAIYLFEMARFRRTLWQSLATPVITTALYFVVFGAAIGARMGEVGGVSYGAFIVPGLMMLTVFTESLSNASFGIHMPKFTGTIYELLSAPISPFETVLAYVGAAATKSVILGLVILTTASLFVPIQVLTRCGCSATWCWWRWPSAWPASSSVSGRAASRSCSSCPCW